ncbi:SAM-dependent methyltransferase [Rhodoplanes tepidamans]|nr:class I SAM-dependent methyltransferase [Rhodoplanes tepidamans]MDQ0358102.1 SAM-dependent methyltransferase [Rhodoplanes tepidamans]
MDDTTVRRIFPQAVPVAGRRWRLGTARGVSYPADRAGVAEIEDISFWFRHRNAVLCEACRRFGRPGPFLDVGGGNGAVARALSAQGADILVVEPGAEGAEIAASRGLPVVEGLVEPDAFVEESVANVGAFDVIEHVADDLALLRLLHRLLAPGGMLFLTVPANTWLWSSDDDFAGHVRRYSASGLAALVTSAGFGVVYSSYFFAPLVLPVLLLRALPSRLGLRRVSTAAATLRDHRRHGIVESAIEACLAREARRLAAGKRPRQGTSILLVARRPARPA